MHLEEQQIGHYRFLHLLGNGGMGSVYLAADLSVKRQVAIKIIRNDTALYLEGDAVNEAAHLFKREANAIAMLDHPNILPLFDYGEENLNGTIITFMVMPYRQEGSLTDWLRRPGKIRPLSPQNAVFIIHQAASALQYAHDHHIIHRDVKPSNFLIRLRPENPSQPDLLLADFGIAKLTTAISSADTGTRGTPAYMPPEQWEDHPVFATDQYALAVLLYELLAGRSLFQGNHSQLMYQHFHAQPRLLSSINPNISPKIDAVLLRALAKNPNDRFPTIATFDQAFQQAMDNRNSIHVTLTIDQQEAIYGTRRTITLPDSRIVTVAVPARVYDGQIIEIEDHGNVPLQGEPASLLIITIAISRIEPTVESSHGSTAIEDTLPVLSNNSGEISDKNSRGLSASKVLLLALVLLLIAGSVAAFFAEQNNMRQQQVAATATAMTNATLIAGTATSIAQNTATAQANATGTAVANATSTAQANATGTAVSNATGTAVAKETATAVANETATATIIAQNPDPYPPYTGKLALYDPLSDNSNGYNWYDDGNSCIFKSGAYHDIQSVTMYFNTCLASSTDFKKFAFQVDMNILKGDCGGLIIRAAALASKYYFFQLCQDGTYALISYSGDSTSTLTNGTDQAMQTGLNQPILIAVVAIDNTIYLYVNNQYIDKVTDNTYSHGEIGFAASDFNNPTEVEFANAKVWTF